jgi:Icc-related predicted phosphoesterase
MKIAAIADPHANTKLVTPDADVLTVSGDLTMRGTLSELAVFRKWLVAQPQKHKIVIAGNHDFCLERKSEVQEAENILAGDGIIYLRDQSVTLDGVHFYGSPWQPWFHDWAFNLRRGYQLQEVWAKIPENVDVFLCHGPPFGYGDRTLAGERVGCEDLLEAIKLKKPKYTLYGHIHEDVGSWVVDGCQLVNCSVGYPVSWYMKQHDKAFVFDL